MSPQKPTATCAWCVAARRPGSSAWLSSAEVTLAVGRVKVGLITALLPPRSLLRPLLSYLELVLEGQRERLIGYQLRSGRLQEARKALLQELQTIGVSRNIHAPGNHVTQPQFASSYQRVTLHDHVIRLTLIAGRLRAGIV